MRHLTNSRSRLLASLSTALMLIPMMALSVSTAAAEPAPAPSTGAASTSPASTSAASAGTASDTAYTYWSFWTAGAGGAASWTYSQQGAGSVVPADGSTQGWRYGVGQTPQLTQEPRAKPDFNQICGSTTVVAGRNRVAVVIDAGTTAEAPAGQNPPGLVGQCASVATTANGLQVLTSVTSLRQSPDGQVCGITGYPGSGCGEAVSLAALLASEKTAQPSPSISTATSPTTSSTSWLPFAVGGVVVLLIVVIAIVVSRNRRRT